MEPVRVKILKNGARLPAYGSAEAAGADLYACLEGPVTILAAKDRVAAHNPLGPISLAACLQVDACSPNFLVQEHPGNADGSDLGVGYIKEPFVLKNGCIETQCNAVLCRILRIRDCQIIR